MSLLLGDSVPVFSRKARAYVAPVDRLTGEPLNFHISQSGSFEPASPPDGWYELGWIDEFERTPGSSTDVQSSGFPASVRQQVRSAIGEEVAFNCLSWNKISFALSSGTQQENILAQEDGKVIAAASVQTGSTASQLMVDSTYAAGLLDGQWVVVDSDYDGKTGYIGSPISGTYLKAALTDVDSTRRFSFNIAQIASIDSGTVSLDSGLPGGVPASGAKLQRMEGFVDCNGSGSFFQEWSLLILLDGEQGNRVLLYYPRVQASNTLSEKKQSFGEGIDTVRLSCKLRALPLADSDSGELVVSYRAYWMAGV